MADARKQRLRSTYKQKGTMDQSERMDNKIQQHADRRAEQLELKLQKLRDRKMFESKSAGVANASAADARSNDGAPDNYDVRTEINRWRKTDWNRQDLKREDTAIAFLQPVHTWLNYSNEEMYQDQLIRELYEPFQQMTCIIECLNHPSDAVKQLALDVLSIITALPDYKNHVELLMKSNLVQYVYPLRHANDAVSILDNLIAKGGVRVRNMLIDPPYQILDLMEENAKRGMTMDETKVNLYLLQRVSKYPFNQVSSSQQESKEHLPRVMSLITGYLTRCINLELSFNHQTAKQHISQSRVIFAETINAALKLYRMLYQQSGQLQLARDWLQTVYKMKLPQAVMSVLTYHIKPTNEGQMFPFDQSSIYRVSEETDHLLNWIGESIQHAGLENQLSVMWCEAGLLAVLEKYLFSYELFSRSSNSIRYRLACALISSRSDRIHLYMLEHRWLAQLAIIMVDDGNSNTHYLAQSCIMLLKEHIGLVQTGENDWCWQSRRTNQQSQPWSLSASDPQSPGYIKYAWDIFDKVYGTNYSDVLQCAAISMLLQWIQTVSSVSNGITQEMAAKSLIAWLEKTCEVSTFFRDEIANAHDCQDNSKSAAMLSKTYESYFLPVIRQLPGYVSEDDDDESGMNIMDEASSQNIEEIQKRILAYRQANGIQ